MKTTLKTIAAVLGMTFTNLVSISAQKPTIVIGGIDNPEASKTNLIRTICIKEINATQKYVAVDQYDILEKTTEKKLENCLGISCLISLGKEFKSDFALAVAYTYTSDRIILNMKLVNVASEKVEKTLSGDFEIQRSEVERITEIMIARLFEMPINAEIEQKLKFKSTTATSMSTTVINNSGPRFGFGFATEENADYLTRKEADGGKGAQPILFNLGYQKEFAYAGTDRFSGLFEFIGSVAGLEQSMFIPSLAILHGIRFGKQNWEFAFGPSFSAKEMVKGSVINDKFQTLKELSEQNIFPSTSETFFRPDSRGVTYFSSSFIVGAGLTVPMGSVNMPLNVYASINKFGTSYGISMGVNIARSKRKINGIRN